MKILLISVSSVLVLSALALGAAHAQVYKSVDENGRTQYTQKPPPGKKAEEVKLKTTPPSGKAESAAPAAKTDSSAADKDKKGKPQPQYEQGKGDTGHPDAQRMRGDWQTGLGQPVQVGFSVEGSTSPVLIRQTWRAAGAYSIGTGTKYIITGLDGRGILTAQEIPKGPEEQLPPSIGYEIQGDLLLLTVSAGPFAGRHRLIRVPPPK